MMVRMNNFNSDSVNSEEMVIKSLMGADDYGICGQ